MICHQLLKYHFIVPYGGMVSETRSTFYGFIELILEYALTDNWQKIKWWSKYYMRANFSRGYTAKSLFCCLEVSKYVLSCQVCCCYLSVITNLLLLFEACSFVRSCIFMMIGKWSINVPFDNVSPSLPLSCCFSLLMCHRLAICMLTW